MQNNIPKLYGLVLGGGKSTRMGSDKRLLQYHKVSQQRHTYNLLSQVCDATFLSLRKDQEVDSDGDLEIIRDTDEFRGPFNGILSAHAAFPEAAWLVLACDLPLMNKETLESLIADRDSTKDATSMATAKTNLPEPLITIWEPKGLKKAIEYLHGTTNSCPRKFLLNSDITQTNPSDDNTLFNANSKEDFEHIIAKLKTL